ncbi:MAG: DUF2095 family protein [Archaeoglobaceae archaeon]|nr:DUF2095 family protein [Archaeoglobaceae archaeon]MCX8151617.1 DUF2095 family protein [Archaeoglobaceae archaeon]MDW8013105.1 DUF2095 family protein [Archaeoglobaceae archaeon]
MEVEKEKFKKMFPNLYKEMFEDRVIPTLFDHLEVCENDQQAIEIINFFEKVGEISKEYAKYLREHVEDLRPLFGTRKRGDYARRGLI